MPGMERTTAMDPRVEMFQRGQPADQFFNMKALAPRPVSEATVFDTDFEDDDDSEIEDNSPRLSMNSMGRRSETTLSSFEEAHTPSPNADEFQGFTFNLRKPVEGPRGPHLFRSSTDSTIHIDDDGELLDLTMSPITPRPSSMQRAAMGMDTPRVPEVPAKHRHLSSLTDAVGDMNLNEVAQWTPRQVARWMYDAGFEPSIIEKFQENDISGAILITLKFEDLRELDIPSFGQRTKVWNEIHVLRGSAPGTPKPPTPFEEELMSPCVELKPLEFRPARQMSTRDHSEERGLKRRKSSRRRQRKPDIITPLESVSIVGIEQLMPKPHKCAKGENCSKWRKQQRLIDNFKKDHPVSPEGGSIWIAGDPGNPLTAARVEEAARPVSDAVPSVVASSDVLGPGPPSFRHPDEESLRNLQQRDPQENVKQFINFQHINTQAEQWSSEEPPTPPYEMFPGLNSPQQAQAPHSGLRGLPRLAIPPPRPAQAQPPRSASANAFSPYRMERVEAMAPDLRSATQTPGSIYRFNTPFSEMDVPVTAIPIGPISRDCSQSVPPNMNYRHAPAPIPAPIRTQSRVSQRRPSFAQLPRVDENISTAPPTQTSFHPNQIQIQNRAPPQQSQQYSPSRNQSQTPQSAYPWSPVNEPSQRTADDVAHAGWMRKRKTKMLRHEWHDAHFTLKGTRLAMHRDERSLETLEYIDVDDYAIACSSLASGGKLNAAFKAMSISRDKKAKDEAAFAFQLIPAQMDKVTRMKKRESKMAERGGALGGHVVMEGKDAGAKAKTHYFAVKSRDERIDWMRELMLAKALKQKSEGFEVSVNGNMI